MLREDPYFGPKIKSLKIWEQAKVRFRVGDRGFFYEVDEEHRVVFVTAADYRKQAYR